MRFPIVAILAAFARELMPSAVSWVRRQKWLATLLFFASLVAGMVALFAGCGTLATVAKQNAGPDIYQHMLKVKVNDKTIHGLGYVLLNDSGYRVKVYPDGSVDRIVIRTCHRVVAYDKPGSWWDRLTGDTNVSVTIERSREIEDVGACAMEIDAYMGRKKQAAFAVIDFQDARPEVSLPYKSDCNGEQLNFRFGVGYCQSAAGLVQSFDFQEPVIAQSNDCPGVVNSKDDAHERWQFPLPRGKCTFYFTSQRKHANGMRMSARLNTIGHTRIPPVD